MFAPVEIPFGGAKRARTAFGSTGHTKRPIDKKLVVVSKDAMAATQVTTVLLTTTFPCTVVGLRWDIAFAQDGGTAEARYFWAIVIVRDGVTVSTLAVSDAANLFQPEQDCIVFGAGTVDNNSTPQQRTGSTKSMRKMMGGDVLMWIGISAATNTIGVRGVIQFFCKS